MVSVGTQLSGAANGLLGGAIATALDGIAGMRGWKWLFLIEGIMTFVVGLSGYLILPNYPDSTPWLSNQQRELALSRTKPSSDLVRKSYSIQTQVFLRQQAMVTVSYVCSTDNNESSFCVGGRIYS